MLVYPGGLFASTLPKQNPKTKPSCIIATGSSYSSFPEPRSLFSLWISEEGRFIPTDCVFASVKPEGRGQARYHPSPGNPTRHTAARVRGISSSKVKRSADPSQRLREEHIHARPRADAVRAVLLPRAALSEGHGGGLKAGKEGRGL